jgi:IS5 family transposase
MGRSRGGRNTKIHALADAKGRLLAILLTGGEAHDCPAAERFIYKGKTSKYLIGDKAYDSAGLRVHLQIAERSLSFPTGAAENSRSASTRVSTRRDGSSRMPSAD